MNIFIIIFLCASAYVAVSSLEYDDPEYKDINNKDYEPLVTSSEEGRAVDNEAPNYDIKDAKNLFDKFILDNKKSYADKNEYDRRYINFVNNLKDIIKINEEGGNADINLFADYSDKELKSLTSLVG